LGSCSIGVPLIAVPENKKMARIFTNILWQRMKLIGL